VRNFRHLHTFLACSAALAALALVLHGGALAAHASDDAVPMPAGAFLCKSIDPVIEHAKIVRQPTSAGLREFVEGKVASGECRVIKTEDVTVKVVDVDQRGFAKVEQKGESGAWWIDAESVWGYFEAPKKVKAWKKP
jgi:hypothetical protein